MPRVTRLDRGHTTASDLRDAVDRELGFAFEYLVQLLVWMVMLMNRGAESEFVVRDGYLDGMEDRPRQPGRRSVTFSLSTSTNDMVTLLHSAYANGSVCAR